MYKNEINIVKNRIIFTLKGKIELVELHEWSNDLLSQIKKLKPGFGVISDIKDCNLTSEVGRMIIQDTQKRAKEMGIGKVVRIVEELNVTTAIQWQHSSRDIGYTAAEASSVLKAEKILDELENNPLPNI